MGLCLCSCLLFFVCSYAWGVATFEQPIISLAPSRYVSLFLSRLSVCLFLSCLSLSLSLSRCLSLSPAVFLSRSLCLALSLSHAISLSRSVCLSLVSRCGLVVRRLAGKQKDLGSIRFGSPFSSLQKLSFMDTVL